MLNKKIAMIYKHFCALSSTVIRKGDNSYGGSLSVLTKRYF